MFPILEFGSIAILCPPMKLLFPAMIEYFAHPSVLLLPYASLLELAKELFPFQKIRLYSPHMISVFWLLSLVIFLFPAKMFAFAELLSVLLLLPTKIVELCPELLLLKPQSER